MDDNKAEETRVSFFNPPSVAEGYDTDSTEAEEEDPETAASENSALMTITSKVEEPTDGLLTFTGLHGSLIFLIGSLWAASELSMNLFSAHVVAASGFTAFLLSAMYVRPCCFLKR